MPIRIQSREEINVLEQYISDLYPLLMKNLALYVIGTESSEVKELHLKVQNLMNEILKAKGRSMMLIERALSESNK